MEEKLLLNQGYIKDKILSDIKLNKKLFVIKGNSGVGKTFLTNQIMNEWAKTNKENFVILAGDDYCIDREFYPFLSYLSENKKIQNNFVGTTKKAIVKASKAIPVAGDLAEYIVENLLNLKESKLEVLNLPLNKEEMDIIFKLQYVMANNSYIVYIDNLHSWDNKSLKLLNFMLKDREKNMKFLSDSIFIINLTINQNSPNANSVKETIEKFNFTTYEVEMIVKDKFKSLLLNLGLNKEINDSLLELLYSITGGHLQITKNIIEYINNSEIINLQDSSQIPVIFQNNSLEILFEERLKNFGANREIITEVLKYASIIGLSFTFFELEYLTKMNSSKIINFINKANELDLVEVKIKGAKFVHEIIRELFESKLNDERSNYFKSFSECLKVLNPNEYRIRATTFLKAGMMDDAISIFVLEYIKKLRKKEIIDNDLRKHIEVLDKDDRIIEYLKIMDKSYTLYHSQKYSECIKNLESIEVIYSKPFLAERDYLLSICLSKNIENNSRIKAVNCLKCYNEMISVDNESEIWTRIMSALMIAYIHINDIVNAKKIEKEIMFFLGQRDKFDLDARDKINIFRRKSGAVYSTEMALLYTEKSVLYFGPSEPSEPPFNPIEYYMALSNHTGNSILCGTFEEAFEYAYKLMMLLKDYQNITFPRVEVALNNYILSGYFANKVTVSQAIKTLNDIVSRKKLNNSDSVLFELNLALMHAISNDVSVARQMLYSLKKKLEERDNIEIYYDFCINSNLMVMEYLMGNIEIALNLWHKTTDSLPVIGDTLYYKRRSKIIKEIFNDNVKVDGQSWMNIIHSRYPGNNEDSLWNFYGKGYLFSDIQFWSES